MRNTEWREARAYAVALLLVGPACGGAVDQTSRGGEGAHSGRGTGGSAAGAGASETGGTGDAGIQSDGGNVSRGGVSDTGGNTDRGGVRDIGGNTSRGGATGVAADTPAARAAACGHVFRAQTACTVPALLSSEVDRRSERFSASCLDEFALPGILHGAADLEGCAAALEASPCGSPDGPPNECDFRGTLAEGAPCILGSQCRSGACEGTLRLREHDDHEWRRATRHVRTALGCQLPLVCAARGARMPNRAGFQPSPT